MLPFRSPRLLRALLCALPLFGAAPAMAAPVDPECPYTYLCVSPSNISVGTSTSNLSSTGTIVGSFSTIDAASSGAVFGSNSRLADGARGAVVGDSSRVENGVSGVAVGDNARVTLLGTAFGQTPTNLSGDVSNVGLGNNVQTNGWANIAIGGGAVAGRGEDTGGLNTGNVSIGNVSTATGRNNVVLGYNANITSLTGMVADPENSVALGANTSTVESNVVAIGNRRLTQVANGVMPTDGTSIAQLTTLTGYLGGGAGVPGGVFTAPTYSLSTGTYHDVGSALLGLDGKSGNAGSNTDPLAVHYDDATSDGVTLQGASGQTQIHNLAAGTQPNDAANVGQLNTTAFNLGSALGGGASYVGGVYTPPTYILSSRGSAGVYNTVGDGLAALDRGVSAVNVRVDNLELGAAGVSPPWLATDAPTSPAVVAGPISVAVGPNAQAGNADTAQNVALGSNAQAGIHGSGMLATAGQATAVGAGANADALAATAVGQGAQVLSGAAFSTAVGAGTVADRPFTTAFGNRQLVQVSPGTQPTDAVNVGQVASVVGAFGGGTSFSNGTLQPPSYLLSGQTFTDVGSALTFLDQRQPTGGGATGPQGPKGDTGPQGPAGQDGAGNGTDAAAVHYDDATQKDVTLQGAGGTQIHNVADGVADHDAANMGQVSAQVQDAIKTANSYADAGDARTEKAANDYTDRRFSQLNDRFDRVAAMGMATSQMTGSFGGVDPTIRTRVGAGVGFSGGHSAMAVGIQHISASGRVSANFGASISGPERALGAGIAIGLGQ